VEQVSWRHRIFKFFRRESLEERRNGRYLPNKTVDWTARNRFAFVLARLSIEPSDYFSGFFHLHFQVLPSGALQSLF
jgi:hypothetical protein